MTKIEKNYDVFFQKNAKNFANDYFLKKIKNNYDVVGQFSSDLKQKSSDNLTPQTSVNGQQNSATNSLSSNSLQNVTQNTNIYPSINHEIKDTRTVINGGNSNSNLESKTYDVNPINSNSVADVLVSNSSVNDFQNTNVDTAVADTEIKDVTEDNSVNVQSLNETDYAAAVTPVAIEPEKEVQIQEVEAIANNSQDFQIDSIPKTFDSDFSDYLDDNNDFDYQNLSNQLDYETNNYENLDLYDYESSENQINYLNETNASFESQNTSFYEDDEGEIKDIQNLLSNLDLDINDLNSDNQEFFEDYFNYLTRQKIKEIVEKKIGFCDEQMLDQLHSISIDENWKELDVEKWLLNPENIKNFKNKSAAISNVKVSDLKLNEVELQNQIPTFKSSKIEDVNAFVINESNSVKEVNNTNNNNTNIETAIKKENDLLEKIVDILSANQKNQKDVQDKIIQNKTNFVKHNNSKRYFKPKHKKVDLPLEYLIKITKLLENKQSRSNRQSNHKQFINVSSNPNDPVLNKIGINQKLLETKVNDKLSVLEEKIGNLNNNFRSTLIEENYRVLLINNQTETLKNYLNERLANLNKPNHLVYQQPGVNIELLNSKNHENKPHIKEIKEEKGLDNKDLSKDLNTFKHEIYNKYNDLDSKVSAFSQINSDIANKFKDFENLIKTFDNKTVQKQTNGFVFQEFDYLNPNVVKNDVGFSNNQIKDNDIKSEFNADFLKNLDTKVEELPKTEANTDFKTDIIDELLNDNLADFGGQIDDIKPNLIAEKIEVFQDKKEELLINDDLGSVDTNTINNVEEDSHTLFELDLFENNNEIDEATDSISIVEPQQEDFEKSQSEEEKEEEKEEILNLDDTDFLELNEMQKLLNQEIEAVVLEDYQTENEVTTKPQNEANYLEEFDTYDFKIWDITNNDEQDDNLEFNQIDLNNSDDFENFYVDNESNTEDTNFSNQATSDFENDFKIVYESNDVSDEFNVLVDNNNSEETKVENEISFVIDEFDVFENVDSQEAEDQKKSTQNTSLDLLENDAETIDYEFDEDKILDNLNKLEDQELEFAISDNQDFAVNDLVAEDKLSNECLELEATKFVNYENKFMSYVGVTRINTNEFKQNISNDGLDDINASTNSEESSISDLSLDNLEETKLNQVNTMPQTQEFDQFEGDKETKIDFLSDPMENTLFVDYQNNYWLDENIVTKSNNDNYNFNLKEYQSEKDESKKLIKNQIFEKNESEIETLKNEMLEELDDVIQDLRNLNVKEGQITGFEDLKIKVRNI
ncbi:MAG: hypothetical protein HUJ42_01270 [Malacoplasma sp.]|nr:hypothetical protein [Malacoplasma sp.]